MRNRIMAVLAGLALMLPLAFGMGAFSSPAQANTNGVAMFFVAHQDDEVLSFGADIKRHVDLGRNTKVVLMTTGEMTGVCIYNLSPVEDFDFNGVPNDLDADGNGEPDLSYAAYSQAERDHCDAVRVAEFKEAVAAMGAEAIIPPDRMPNEGVTREAAANLMQRFVDRFPGGSFKTHTYHEDRWPVGHVDHDALGHALRYRVNFASNGNQITDKRFYIKTNQWGAAETEGFGPYTPEINIDNALAAYDRVGHYSVPRSFDEQWSGDTGHNGAVGPAGTQGEVNMGPRGGAHSLVHTPAQ